MIDKLFLFTNQEILFSAMYIVVLIAGMYISLKHNVQPILTLMLIFIASLVYVAITSLVNAGVYNYFRGMESLDNLIVFPGIFTIIFMIKIMKGVFRIPNIVTDKLLGILFMLFTVFQTKEFFTSSKLLSSSIVNQTIPAGLQMFQLNPLQNSASIFPQSVIGNPIVFMLATVLLVCTIFLIVSSKFRYPGNSLLFTMLILMAFLFISLFNSYPIELPYLNVRMMGLNVIQWGLTLVMVLMTAYMIAKENNYGRRKKEILYKPPGEYRILIIYLSISLLSLQVTAILNDLYIKLLFTGYFILTGYMIFYFMKKIERHYLKYGTVSIIMLIFIFFLRSQNPQSNETEIIIPQSPHDLGTNTYQIHYDTQNQDNLISFVLYSPDSGHDKD